MRSLMVVMAVMMVVVMMVLAMVVPPPAHVRRHALPGRQMITIHHAGLGDVDCDVTMLGTLPSKMCRRCTRK